MISAFIFFAHFMFLLLIFTWRWQKEGISGAILNVSLILILFAVGWTITGMVAKFLMEPKGLGIYYDRDTFSLTLLTIIEIIFYRFYYKQSTADGKETQ
jgi:formate hydrogenlyase subunit 3/multisubunit Na+/H+ antiporter MnhD subunit